MIEAPEDAGTKTTRHVAEARSEGEDDGDDTDGRDDQ